MASFDIRGVEPSAFTKRVLTGDLLTEINIFRTSSPVTQKLFSPDNSTQERLPGTFFG
jgi:hypothetical protein